MKKASLILAAITCMAAATHAQEGESARFGIKLAPNFAWTHPDTKGVSSDGSKMGYTFGLMMEFPIGTTGNYRFASGVYLNNIGGKFTVDYEYQEVPNGTTLKKALPYDISLRYIEVPLTIKMMTNEIGYMRYFGQLGLSSAFNIRAKADYDNPILDASLAYTTGFETLEDEDVQDDVALFKAALVVGGGLEYNFSGNTTLLVGLTYNSAFTNAVHDLEYNGKKTELMANYLELTLGIFF